MGTGVFMGMRASAMTAPSLSLVQVLAAVLALSTASAYQLPVHRSSPGRQSGPQNRAVVSEASSLCANCHVGVCPSANACKEQRSLLRERESKSELPVFSTALEQELLILKLKSWFKGDFDNKIQVDEDLAASRAPREGGGHEHIHCKVLDVDLAEEDSRHSLLAHYYFGDDPSRTFRMRLYTFAAAQDPDGSMSVKMQIHYLSEERIAALKAGTDPASIDWRNQDVTHPIEDVDVTWRPRGDHFHGTLDKDSVTIFSPTMQAPIIIKDEVTLWADQLWVNDRGYTADGKQIYGNFHGVPYKLNKV